MTASARFAGALERAFTSLHDGRSGQADHPGCAEHGSPERWIEGHWERRHGSHCVCRLLAAAACADPSALDYGFCRRVLQKRWRMTCDHVSQGRREKVTPILPPHDPHDPLQALLIANADISPD